MTSLTQRPDEALADVHPAPGHPRRRTVWGAGRLVAVALLSTIAVFALLGPLAWSDPVAQRLGDYLAPPTWAEPLGRDHLGRSAMARLAHATRLSLGLALLCVSTAAVLGTLLGLLAAWRGGWVDALLRGLSETMLAVPALLVVLIVATIASGTLWTLYLGMALAQWVEYFRVVRARSGVLLRGPAVEAAGLLGLGRLHVLRYHLWPDLSGVLGTLAVVGLATSVLTMSTLGYVGVGVKPPRADLGLLLTEAFPLYHEAPWLTLAPVVVLAALTWSLFALRTRPTRTPEVSA